MSTARWGVAVREDTFGIDFTEAGADGRRRPIGGVVQLRGTPEVVLADGHTVFLDGLSAVLAHSGCRVVATASTREALLEQVRAVRPALCIIDSQFPDGDGIEALQEIEALSPATKVVVLTADDGPKNLQRALELGAAGYVHKARGVPALIAVLRRVAAGEIVVEGTFSSPRASSRQRSEQLQLLASYLTPRELECLALLAAGSSTTAIARRLGVSTTTIRSHVQAVLTKLSVHSRLEAASLAIRYGLVETAAEPESELALNRHD
jgi:two-component system, NarL family, nitrate/nitrite response regulator NarL